MAESVDASDLKSDWANNSVPVQVWPGAILRQGKSLVFLVVKKIKNEWGLLVQFGFACLYKLSQF